jgi:hypothetical protein
LPRLLPALAALFLASACAVQPGQPACQPRRLQVANVATRPVEQLYYGRPGAWGEDLLAGIEMTPGQARSVVLPGIAGQVLRAVWTDGRAVELSGLDPCRNSRIVLADGIIRAD